MKPKDVCKAVASLRARRHETQTIFGQGLGVSLPTIQRWESLVPPSGAALLRVMRLADSCRSGDLGDIFCACLSSELGISVGPLRESESTEELTLP